MKLPKSSCKVCGLSLRCDASPQSVEFIFEHRWLVKDEELLLKEMAAPLCLPCVLKAFDLTFVGRARIDFVTAVAKLTAQQIATTAYISQMKPKKGRSKWPLNRFVESDARDRFILRLLCLQLPAWDTRRLGNEFSRAGGCHAIFAPMALHRRMRRQFGIKGQICKSLRDQLKGRLDEGRRERFHEFLTIVEDYRDFEKECASGRFAKRAHCRAFGIMDTQIGWHERLKAWESSAYDYAPRWALPIDQRLKIFKYEKSHPYIEDKDRSPDWFNDWARLLCADARRESKFKDAA